MDIALYSASFEVLEVNGLKTKYTSIQYIDEAVNKTSFLVV